jgi:hypothetical protein
MRDACAGSMEAARRAGIIPASAAAAPSVAMADENKSKFASKRMQRQGAEKIGVAGITERADCSLMKNGCPKRDTRVENGLRMKKSLRNRENPCDHFPEIPSAPGGVVEASAMLAAPNFERRSFWRDKLEPSRISR